MNEGVFRILSSLANGKSQKRDEIVRIAGEAPTVLADALRRHPKWFEEQDRELCCTRQGLVALAMEQRARIPGRREAGEHGELLEPYLAVARGRGPAKRELDQVYATTETVLSRAEHLIAGGDVQRGLLFLGDDDLTSVAVQLHGTGRPVTVLDVDEELLAITKGAADEQEFELSTVAHDLRQPLPKKMSGRYGCVFTDPPYATEGFALFISRAIELLKPDGRLFVCFGSSRRSSERSVQKQRVLAEAGLAVEAVWEDFNAYEGGEAIGSRSSMWRLSMTPMAKPLIQGEYEGELYTSRSPKA